MRLCSWVGPRYFVPFVVLLAVVTHVTADQDRPNERHYYVAVVQIDWDYSGNDSFSFGSTYKKAVFREYEKGFKQAKAHPSWLGLLGPTLKGQEGETIVVTFRNMADRYYSIHPHGIAYGKQSEGAQYFDNTSLKEKEDDAVRPGGEHTYYWEVTADVAPQRGDPACLTYTYVSHLSVVQDYNTGLIGTLLICKPGSLNELGEQVHFHQEYVFLFGVFDEKESWFTPAGYSANNHVKHTINGFSSGSLPDVHICAHCSVSLHLVGMSSEPEVFSVHMNGQVLLHKGHKTSTVGLISGTATTASMRAVHPGRWLLSSQVGEHLEVGMHGFVDVRTCEGFQAPKRALTINQQLHSKEWTYYIAAEEITWNYAPNMPTYIDEDFKLKFLEEGNHRIGRTYKKAVFTQYTDATFTVRAENKQRKAEVGILGPVIRAQIRDVIWVVFKNMASRPYSIYPHGLTIEKSQEGATYPEGGNQTHAVQPGQNHTYEWRVVDEDEPMDEDSRCLTYLYHSAVDTPRDIASGLIGPLLVCKSRSLNVRNVQLKADKEQHAMFAVFDENRSWYMDDNIRTYCGAGRVNKADRDFYKSNVMHTINGYVFESGQVLGFCNGEIATWHVSSVGAQDYIQTVTFYGHTFELNERTEDILSLYPMTGETIFMNMDNVGIWLLVSLNSHETTKGMRLKFTDVECFRDYQYEYNDYEGESKDFSVWKPPTLEDLKKENEKPTEKVETIIEVDEYTDIYADYLGLRSLKNQSQDSDVEQLDLSFLDYDGVDVPVQVVNNNATTTKTEMGISTATTEPEPTALDRIETLLFGERENGRINLTANNQFNQSITEIATQTYNSTAITEDKNIVDSVSLYTKEILESNDTNLLSIIISYVTNVNESMNTTEEPERRNQTFGAMTNLINSTGNTNSSNNGTEALSSHNTTVGRPMFNSSEGLNYNHTEGVTTLLGQYNQSFNQSITEIATQTYNSTAITEDKNIVDSVSLYTKEILESNDTNLLSIIISYVTNVNESMNTTEEPERRNQTFGAMTNIINSTGNTNSSNNGTEALSSHNTTVGRPMFNSSEGLNYNHTEGVTTLLGQYNQSSSAESLSNETSVSDNLPPSIHPPNNSSEEQRDSVSLEEIVIYLKNHSAHGIKTIPLEHQGHNWTYETHQMVPIEIPDDIIKYLPLKPTPNPTRLKKPKTRRVTRPHRPQKGLGMKTKRRKAYNPQPRSAVAFSPRGFNPGMSPRGSRPAMPVSSEEDLINMPVVIGVPRPDFSDYELYVAGEVTDHLVLGGMDADIKENEYEYVSYKDPYSSNEQMKSFTLDETTKYHLKMAGQNAKTYFISAEEVEWDYSGYGKRQEKSLQSNRETKFNKVVFRGYRDGTFSTPDMRGEMEEHLGILGPVIKAEVGQSILVVFRNKASRPYSLHPNGVSYTKQAEGLSYEDESKYWHKYDNEVQPNTTFTYSWKINERVGPMSDESYCRTWAYYSGVNPEKDIHSGLIGPLLVCRTGTMNTTLVDMREFLLLFMTFDESQSWYYEKNMERRTRKSRGRAIDPNRNLKFHSINGIIYSLKGLRMYTKQLARWHLINMGSPKDVHSVHFHGQTFIHNGFRQAVYPLLPGGFATLEMWPSKPGLWQLETEVGAMQREGMQTLFLVLDNECYHPLGMESESVIDLQITADNTRGYWEPHLARLNNQGKYNAWSTEKEDSWIQVDFLRPVVISQVATQGAKQMFHSQFVVNYTISYSTDRKKWIFFKGDSQAFRKTFPGNNDASATKKNTFFPPLIGRYIRLHPIKWYNKATVRMEFYGCELDGCSVPLGMENGWIKDHHIMASSTASGWFGGVWSASLARINTQGALNAWQAKYNNMNQWLQIELRQVKKITGIITQGAKSLGTEMYVISYALEYSEDGKRWYQYSDDEDYMSKTFIGNTDNHGHVKNYIYPPIFSRFIRIIPKSWKNAITMRVELLGCDFE